MAIWEPGPSDSSGISSGLDANAAYMGTAGVHLPAIDFPNGYPGARSRLCPLYPIRCFRKCDRRIRHGNADDQSISFHLSCSSDLRAGQSWDSGPGIQASYTWSKSLDDTSSVIGALVGRRRW